MSEPYYHGWTAHGRTIHVGPLPGRKSVALYRMDGGLSPVHPALDVLAYFRNEGAARRFLADMDAMLWVGPVRVDGGAS